MELALRPYQSECVDAIWAEIKINKSALVSLPCGAGKTQIIIGLMKRSIELYPQFKCMFLVNQLNLLDQTVKRTQTYLGDIVGSYCGKEKDLDRPIVVATIQSIRKKPTHLNVVIIDEAQLFNEGSGSYADFVLKCLEINPKLKIVACTATPWRSSGKIHGEGKLFTHICYKRDLKWAQENKYLVPVYLKHSNEQFNTAKLRIRAGEYAQEDVEALTQDYDKIERQLDDALPQIIDRKKIVWMCSSIRHCEMVFKSLSKRDETCAIIHSKQEMKDRDKNVEMFENTEIRHLVFVTIVSCGWDFPPTDTVILMRPTRSAAMMIQVVGRALRPSPGKFHALVLDFGGVVQNCGPLDDPVIVEKGERGTLKKINAKFCKACLSYCHISAKVCVDCGHPFHEDKPRLQNLSERSQSGSILKQPKIARVKSLVIENYHSIKTNKDSLRVTYRLADILSDNIKEYFSKDNSFFINKRMSELNINDYDLNVTYHIIGRSIEIEREGAYDKIKRVIRD